MSRAFLACSATWLAAGGAALLARRMVRFGFLYILMIVAFGCVTGFVAGALRSHLVRAPVVSEATRPVMLEDLAGRR